MKIYQIVNLAVLSLVISIAFAVAAWTDGQVAPGWNPAVFQDASTIKIMWRALAQQRISTSSTLSYQNAGRGTKGRGG